MSFVEVAGLNPEAFVHKPVTDKVYSSHRMVDVSPTNDNADVQY